MFILYFQIHRSKAYDWKWWLTLQIIGCVNSVWFSQPLQEFSEFAWLASMQLNQPTYKTFSFVQIIIFVHPVWFSRPQHELSEFTFFACSVVKFKYRKPLTFVLYGSKIWTPFIVWEQKQMMIYTRIVIIPSSRLLAFNTFTLFLHLCPEER